MKMKIIMADSQDELTRDDMEEAAVIAVNKPTGGQRKYGIVHIIKSKWTQPGPTTWRRLGADVSIALANFEGLSDKLATNFEEWPQESAR